MFWSPMMVGVKNFSEKIYRPLIITDIMMPNIVSYDFYQWYSISLGSAFLFTTAKTSERIRFMDYLRQMIYSKTL